MHHQGVEVTYVDADHVRYRERHRTTLISIRREPFENKVSISARSIIQWDAPFQNDSIDASHVVEKLTQAFKYDGFKVFIE